MDTQPASGRELRGRVRAVPVLNLPAFRARTPVRRPDDGKNLNRCFPGDPAGTLAERLAHDTFTAADHRLRRADRRALRRHGRGPGAVHALRGRAGRGARPEPIAMAYGLPYVIRQEPGPDRAVGGHLERAAAAAIGIPAITAEAGGCGLVESRAVAAARPRAAPVSCAHLGMTERRRGRRRAGADDPDPVPVAALPAGGLVGAGCRAPASRSPRARCSARSAAWTAPRCCETINAPADGVPIFITSSPPWPTTACCSAWARGRHRNTSGPGGRG